jgi:hypothetical protein
MVTALVAGAVVPLWDRDLLRALMAAVERVAPDHVTVWQLGVMNDDGAVYRQIVAEGPTESLNIIECFARQAFRLVELQGQAVMRRELPGHR